MSKDGVECVENEVEARNRKLVYSNQGSVYLNSSFQRLLGNDRWSVVLFITDFDRSRF